MARSRTAGALFALLISAAFAAQAELPANYAITLQTDTFPPFNMGPNSKSFARGDDVQGIEPIPCATSFAVPASPTT